VIIVMWCIPSSFIALSLRWGPKWM
jgi:hypothetical protein